MRRDFYATLFLLTIQYSIKGGLSQQKDDSLTQNRWIWGYDTQTRGTIERNNQPVTERAKFTSPTFSTSPSPFFGAFVSSTTEPWPEYCLPFNKPKPNFRKPGRRISAVKCLEYSYALRVRVKDQENILKCIQYVNKKYHVYAAIGGYSTAPGEYPHMGALGWKATTGTWIFKCGSSLISDKFVLTAAHCAEASKSDTAIADTVPKIVRLGDKNILDSKNRYKTPKDVNILRIIVHPEYKPPKQYFDIALIELGERVTFSKFVHPACLANAFKPGTQATLTGWGVVEAGSRDISPELQAATVDIIDSKQCDDLLKPSRNRNWCGMQRHQLCAGKLAGGVDACQGDSGGPLQVKIRQNITTQGQMHYVFGIISFGVGCAHPNLPGMYTRISSFYDWIENIVWKDDIVS